MTLLPVTLLDYTVCHGEISKNTGPISTQKGCCDLIVYEWVP